MYLWLNSLALLGQAPPPRQPSAEEGVAALFGICCQFIIMAVILVPAIAGLWKCFSKANQPGWASIIPIYNTIVMLQIVGRPIWWIALCFIPCVNLVIAIIVAIDFAKSFGKDVGYGIGLAFLPFIFYPMLGFGSATYQGPSVRG